MLVKLAVIYVFEMAAVFAGGIGVALNIILFFAASDFFSVVSYAVSGLLSRDAMLFSLLVDQDR